jgi:hypothetical protein
MKSLVRRRLSILLGNVWDGWDAGTGGPRQWPRHRTGLIATRGFKMAKNADGPWLYSYQQLRFIQWAGALTLFVSLTRARARVLSKFGPLPRGTRTTPLILQAHSLVTPKFRIPN